MNWVLVLNDKPPYSFESRERLEAWMAEDLPTLRLGLKPFAEYGNYRLFAAGAAIVIEFVA